MIELISRPIALENPTFASFIHTWQQRFDPRIDPYMTEPGNYFDSTNDGQRYFSQEEIEAIHKKEIGEFELLRDRIEPITLVEHEELIYNLSFRDIIFFTLRSRMVNLLHLTPSII